MNAIGKYSVRERAMDWAAAFWEGKVLDPVPGPMPAYAHTTPEPDDLPPERNDPTPEEVPQPDPVPIQDPIPHQEPIRGKR
jgi:hypothetical protein